MFYGRMPAETGVHTNEWPMEHLPTIGNWLSEQAGYTAPTRKYHADRNLRYSWI